jgi:lysophospholipase L1-like esterase
MRQFFAAIGLLVAFGVAPAATQRDAGPAPRVAPPPTARPSAGEAHWVGTWASSQQVPVTSRPAPAAELNDTTLRQVVRVTLGGERVRIRLSNVFGTRPLRIESVHVARSLDPASARIDPARGRAVTFSGSFSVVIPAGADRVSDPVALAVPPMSHLAVSLYLPQGPAQRTSHVWALATSYLARGNRSAAPDLPGARAVGRWYLLSGVDVDAPADGAAIVAFGDSITDGFGVPPNSDRRWPDFLARRLQADPATRHLAVLNHGIGGNRVLADGFGPAALARFERDVLAQPGIRFLILLEGINDLGMLTRDGPASPAAHRALVADIIAAYAQMVARARARGVRAIGATLLPFGGATEYHPAAASEADRQAINAWIRARGNFDAVVDFDAAMRDPADPTRMRRAFDSGDGLHPSIAGYRAMADAVPLSLFR